MITKIYHPDGHRMFPAEIAEWSNMVHKIGGGKGKPFVVQDFAQNDEDGFSAVNRLSGNLCLCGFEKRVKNNPSKGEFDLLPLDSIEVISGNKAYMKCRRCGCYSHL